MCKLATFVFCEEWSAAATAVAPRRRSYRVSMRPSNPRKSSSGHRIAANRFWNEMEELYSRLAERRARGSEGGSVPEEEVRGLPDYTTDVFDHRREEGENELNERCEIRRDKMDSILNSLDNGLNSLDNRLNNSLNNGLGSLNRPQGQRARLESDDVSLRDSSSEDGDHDDQDEEDEEAFNLRLVWNDLGLPSPPKVLPDLDKLTF